MANLRGAYLAFAHDRPADWDFLRAWQPSVVRLMLPGSHSDPASVDVNRIRRVYEAAGGAQILLRCWDVDDRNGQAYTEMIADPEMAAQAHVWWWRDVFSRVPDVPATKLVAGLINEPNTQDHGNRLYAYTEHACYLATECDMRLGVFCFSVGNPAKAGEATHDWPYFARLEPNIVGGDHVVILHEYMQPEGMYAVWTDDQGNERHDYGNLIGRHLHSGLTRAPIILGEWGIDGLLYNRHPHPQYGNNGWLSFRELWGPERYADEYVECIRQAAPNVIAICPFISDAPSHQWDSFEMQTAYGALLARKGLCERETVPAQGGHTVHLPQVGSAPQPPTAEPEQPQPVDGDDMTWDDGPAADYFSRAYAFVARWEGGWSDNELDPGGATMRGITLGTFTAWRKGQGMAAPSKEDLRAIQDDEVLAIYRSWYWHASGADELPWPLALVQFDTAILHGSGQARQWLRDSGGNVARYLALRLRSYTAMGHWHAFGAGWTRRVADLLDETALQR